MFSNSTNDLILSPSLASTFSLRPTPLYCIKHIPGPRNSICSMKSNPVQRILDDFHVLKFLNRGDNGNVYLARDIRTNKEYALKVVPKSTMDSTTAANEGRLQTLIATKEGSFLLPVKASWHDTCNYYIITAFLPGGDLAKELSESGSFDEDRSRFYGAEMILMVEELRKDRIIHRDIKPTNILINEQGHLRLTGFGCAKKFDAPKEFEALDSLTSALVFDVDPDCESGAFFTDIPNPEFKTNEICGTPHFMSPQRTAGKDYGDQEDLWSVGVILYLMMTGRLPFGNDHENRTDITLCVLHKPVEFEAMDLVSDNARSLLIGMLTKDTCTRLSMEQIKNHAFFSGFNWDQVKTQKCKAPWIPSIAPVPNIPLPVSPILRGVMYEEWNDPLPSYRYTSPKMDEPGPVTTHGAFKMMVAKVFGFGGATETTVFHGREGVKEEGGVVDDEDEDEDFNHLPIQTIDWSDFPFGSHPYDRRMYPEDVFCALYEAFSEGTTGPTDRAQEPTPSALQEVSDAQARLSPLSSLRRSLSLQALSTHVACITPSLTCISVHPGSIIPLSFYQQLAEAAQISPDSNVQRIGDAVIGGTWPSNGGSEASKDASVFEDSRKESNEAYELGLFSFETDLGNPTSSLTNDVFSHPRPAPLPFSTPPLSPTQTLVSPTDSPTPTLVGGFSPPLSPSQFLGIPSRRVRRGPSDRMDEKTFFVQHAEYRLRPEHIRARRELEAGKGKKINLAAESIQGEPPVKLDAGSGAEKSKKKEHCLAHGTFSRTALLATQTQVTVVGDLEVREGEERRRSLDLLKVVDEEERKREALLVSEGFVERVWGHLGKVFGSS